MCAWLYSKSTKTSLSVIRHFIKYGLCMLARVCVCACYLRGFVGSPAVLVAMEAGQEHVLISVHLTKAQCLMRIITNNIVAVEQLLSLCVSILAEKKRDERMRWEDKEERRKKCIYFGSLHLLWVSKHIYMCQQCMHL